VIPSALLIQGESVVIFWGDYTTLWWVVFGMTIFSILLVRVGLAHFRREELLGREIDVLNFRWGWKIFYTSFRSSANSIGKWYRSVFNAINANWIPMVIVSLIFVFGVYIGYLQTYRFKIALDQFGVNNIENQMVDIMKNTPIYSSTSILGYFWQNLRVLLVALPLGLFTFGVVGVLPGIASLGIMGYLMGLLNQAGLTPLQFLTAFILPHGIFEIPAAIIATASVFRSGVLIATPDPNRSVSEIILQSLAQWVKIMLGVVIPLLLVAACVEAWVTPRIAYLVLR
jgi:uncharacterized membrane protein SpoIIM required for sporulation